MIKMNKFIVLLTISLFFVFPVSAQTMSETQIRQKINEVASQMKSMQCDFTQTKKLKMLNDKLVSKGKMYYQQSNRLRWEYVTPYAYIFLLNDSKVYLKSNQHNDVIDVQQNKVFKEIARIMMNSVVGNCLNDDKDFNVRISDTANEYVANLSPLRKDMKQMFQKIVLHFNKKSSTVSMVELIEKNGDNTVIELNNILINTKIDAKVFTVD